MKVFISWSGDRSLAVAKALRNWLPRVIQAVRPWMSETDIEKGTRWEQVIGSELSQTKLGIVCLTPENLDSRWLNFEAGAISKSIDQTYLFTYLLELKPTDLEGPLSQFNHTKVDKEDTRKLVHTINRALEIQALSESIIDDSFDLHWPRLEDSFKNLPPVNASDVPARSLNDMVEEILTLVRFQSKGPRIYKREDFLLRLPSTTGWSQEDAQLLTDYYESVTKNLRLKSADTDILNTTIELLDRLANDRGFAEEWVQNLKEINWTK